MTGGTQPRLDALDLRILTVLQREGRITKLRLADAVGLSPSPCHERVKRLERAGYVRGYHADIDLDRLVSAATIFVEVTLAKHAAHDFERFEATIMEIPEIVACHAIGGGMDYLLQVVARDMGHYQQLIEDLLARDIGIERYFTYVVTKAIKQTQPPLDTLLRQPADTGSTV
ncbi:transcriptional regulator, AsnC family [Limimonas halophila]|uniref:Transcriptional regulator, AsnC family n=1 Tax=Limimonas halophila TaxID=1082479 RepID=A0A1G7LKK5_9PROT|nr:Lrp/AsnC family transcriptional regulator [Limimonas halophila]SDF50038.1 transcriptional regulator, AsnC family [Limimonas halophila]